MVGDLEPAPQALGIKRKVAERLAREGEFRLRSGRSAGSPGTVRELLDFLDGVEPEGRVLGEMDGR